MTTTGVDEHAQLPARRTAVNATVTEVAGAVVRAVTATPFSLAEIVTVGPDALIGEVIALEGADAILQVYEDTAGIMPGHPVVGTSRPLSIALGPGLLGQVLDGIGRPLERLARTEGDFLGRGMTAPTLDPVRCWTFQPLIHPGMDITGGTVIGDIAETPAIRHHVLVPPDIGGRVEWVVEAGAITVNTVIARIRRPSAAIVELTAQHQWRVRAPRPFVERLPSEGLLVTGQRVLDTFFPLPLGGAAGMPGGFGTGKTVMQHQLCKWAAADVIVYVGCGERGNEMTDMLRRLPELIDPRRGRPLAERTVMIANTSNMPVAAREASIYSGITIAEYYRDMGYDVVLLADSTSRWAEALREISGRLGEMPAEESYPSYLSSRLAAFYERAGRVRTLSGREGSVTLVSAISPAGGDLTEPVTRHTQRFTRTFWTLDQGLAAARVFPAVSTRDSYSRMSPELVAWWRRAVAADWPDLRQDALAMLDEAHALEATARLIGTDALPERQQFVLRMAQCFEEGFLRQSALDPQDAFCPLLRQYALLRLLLRIRDRGLTAIERGLGAAALAGLPELAAIERAKTTAADDSALDGLAGAFADACTQLEAARASTPAGTGP